MPPPEEPLDDNEVLARHRLEEILGVKLHRLTPQGPGRRHDFETTRSDGQIVVVEVTGRLDGDLFGQLAAIRHRLPSFPLPGSAKLWLVNVRAYAHVRAIRQDEVGQLLLDLEAAGRTTATGRGNYLDPFVQRLRDLRIGAVYAFDSPGPGKVVIGSEGPVGSRGWYGAEIDAWLAEFLASDLAQDKVDKLNEVANAAERHLAIVLDPSSPEGLAIPVGLSDRDEPAAADLVMPSLEPPERLTHLWLFPAVTSWPGLRWARGEEWTIVPPLQPLGSEG